MCIVSNVSDVYGPKFEPWFQPNPMLPWSTITTTPEAVKPTASITFTPPQLTPEDIKELKALIAEFKEMMGMAKKLDVALKQPDCVDPEKAKLEGRVAELEKALKKLSRKKPKKSA